MGEFTIRLGEQNDIKEIVSLYDDLNDYLADKGFTGWKKHVYPAENTAADGVNSGSMYVVETEGKICASVILNSEQMLEYSTVDWSFSAQPEEVLVIHTLTIHPDYTSKGLATKLLEFAESLVKEKRMKVIRLDTSDNNTPAAALYCKRGYRLAGVYPLRIAGSTHKLFKCFEKQIV